MKKSILILAVSMLTGCIAFAQTGLKIKSSIPTNRGMKTNVEVHFEEFYLNSSLNSQFSVSTLLGDNTIVETFDVMPVYTYKLSGIPSIQIMWDSVANTLRAKGLVVESL